MMAYEKLADDKQTIADLTALLDSIGGACEFPVVENKPQLAATIVKAIKRSQAINRDLKMELETRGRTLLELEAKARALLAIAELATAHAERVAAQEERDPSDEVWDARRIIDAIKKGEEF